MSYTMVRIVCLVLGFGLMSLLARSQNIDGIEHFFDTESGVGSGTIIPFASAPTYSSPQVIAASALMNGFHTIWSRARGSQETIIYSGLTGTFHPYDTITGGTSSAVGLVMHSIPSLSKLEIRTTSGTFQNGEPIVGKNGIIGAGSVITGNATITTYSSVEVQWGLPEARLVLIDPTGAGVIEIDRLEYFFNIDPGVGNGTIIGVTQGNIIDQVNVVTSGILPSGFHTLFVRARAVGGSWGLPESRLVLVDPTGAGIIEIDQLEYFFDTDPGVGLGNTLSVTQGNMISQMDNIVANALPVGFHTLWVRAKETGGSWGLSESRLVLVDPSGAVSSDIMALEYFVNTDPGVGNGIDIPITPALTINDMIDLAGASIPLGNNTIHVRAQNADGVWGLAETQSFISEVDNALNFDGVDDFVSIPDAPSLDLTTTGTITAWVNGQSFEMQSGNIRRVLMKQSSPGTNLGSPYQFTITTDGKVVFTASDNSSSEVSASTCSIETNDWNHVAVTWNGTIVNIYIDGVLDSTQPQTIIPFTNDQPLIIGSFQTNGAGHWIGSIDEVSLWTVVKSDAEIQNIMTLGLVGNETNLSAYYQFDEGTSGGTNGGITTLPDLTSNANHGTLNNFALSGTSSNWVVSTFQSDLPGEPVGLFANEISTTQIDLTWLDKSFNETDFIIERSMDNNSSFSLLGMVGADVTAFSDNTVTAGNRYFYRVLATNANGNSLPSNEKFASTITPPGNALQLDGVDDYILINNSPDMDFGAGDFTIETWAQINVLHQGGFVNAINFNSGSGWGLVPENDGTVIFQIGHGNDNDKIAAVMTTGNWNHIAAVKSGTDIKLYLNGGEVATGTTARTIDNGFEVNLGRRYVDTDMFYLDGSMDEVRIWNKARTVGEIQGTQFTTLTGSEPNLAAYYRFDQGLAGMDNNGPPIIDNLPDRSLNNNDGMLNNFALDNATSNWVSSDAPLISGGVIQQDIDALTELFTALDGPNWADSTNWLKPDVSTWFGVAVGNNRVTGLELPSNNLSGELPASFTNLTGLDSLNLSGNNITLIPDLLGLLVLNEPDVSGNRLQFGSIEANVGILGIIYSPQQPIFVAQDELQEINIDVVIDRTITGTANVYTWFKDDIPLADQIGPTLTLTGVQFADEGTYRAVVTNTIAPELTFNTANFTLTISSLERDRIALNNIFTATGGPTWIEAAGWDGDDLSARFGVTVTNNRVSAISLPNNNLQGNMAEDLRDIGQLVSINLAGNELRSLPDVTRLTQLSSLNVEGNRLGFGDLEPNLSVTGFSFKPQRRFGLTTDPRVPVNEDFGVSIDISGDNNLYQWFRKLRRTAEDVPGLPVEGATGPTYIIEDINFDNMGIYYVEVRSPLIPDFAIRNRNQNVFAVTNISGTTFLNQTAGVTMGEGDVLLYEITAPGQPFILTDSASVTAQGTYLFNDIVLSDYILLGRPGPSVIGEVLQTYFRRTNDWVVADRLQLRNVVTGIDIDMLAEPVLFDPTLGDARILGTLESDFPDPVDPEAGLRVKARRRVRRAGISLNKLVTRRRVLQQELVLVAFTETDENGEFSFGDIPPGDYLINIQIPGVPMDTTNLIEFKIEESKENQTFQVEALALPDAIKLELIEETGFYRKYFKNLEVYPNPAKDYVTVAYDKLNSASLEVRLMDVTGRVLKTELIEGGEIKELNIDLSGMEAGVYLLNLIDTDQSSLIVASYRLIVGE